MLTPAFDYLSLLNTTIDDISRREGFESDTLEDLPPMSTGLLVMDLLYGGGIRPGWYTHFGREQSCKTTGALTIMASAIKHKVPLIAFCDYENSTRNSKIYVGNILQGMGVTTPIDEIFGKHNKKTGDWEIPPKVRFRSESRGDVFFTWLHNILVALPDKRCINGEWWVVFDETKENVAKLGEFANKTMAKRYGKGLWLPATDGGTLQAVIFVDSYPGMNPLANDEDDPNQTIALQARMFSAGLRRVKGRLASKMVAVVGINQLRVNPLAMYGPNEVEPCGESLKFNSDVRCKFTPRASGFPLWGEINKESKFEEEPSAEGEGIDRYRYVQIFTFKNKLWTPNRLGWLRLWHSDYEGMGRGFDPVFDTAYYLMLTGQLKGRGRKSMQIKLRGVGMKDFVPIKWNDLKWWVLGDKDEHAEICERLGLQKVFGLRSLCFKQLENGVAEKMYVAQDHGREMPSEYETVEELKADDKVETKEAQDKAPETPEAKEAPKKKTTKKAEPVEAKAETAPKEAKPKETEEAKPKARRKKKAEKPAETEQTTEPAVETPAEPAKETPAEEAPVAEPKETSKAESEPVKTSTDKPQEKSSEQVSEAFAESEKGEKHPFAEDDTPKDDFEAFDDFESEGTFKEEDFE